MSFVRNNLKMRKPDRCPSLELPAVRSIDKNVYISRVTMLVLCRLETHDIAVVAHFKKIINERTNDYTL
ncbi:hypothetical protein BH09PAT2_BH09PAT2_06980 [soil metagenome]